MARQVVKADTIRAASILLLAAVALAGCGAFASDPPQAMVTLYGRNGGPAELAWFAIDPTSPTEPQSGIL